MENPNELSSFRKSVNVKFGQVNDRLNQIQPKVDAMHDYILTQKGIEEGKSLYRRDGGVNISRDAWGLILKLVGVILAILGIAKLR